MTSKLNVFVACPYTLFPLDDYKKSFQEAGKNFDVTFKFADEQITNLHVLTKITNYIRDHDISLFDVTGWNANVTLELGLAVGLGRKYYILLNTKIDSSKDVPSDIKGLDRLQYNSNSELTAKLIFLLKQEMPSLKSKSDSAFDSIKTRIIDALENQQGIGVKKIAEALQEDKPLVQSVVRAMYQAGELKSRGDTKGTVHYTADCDLRTM